MGVDVEEIDKNFSKKQNHNKDRDYSSDFTRFLEQTRYYKLIESRVQTLENIILCIA